MSKKEIYRLQLSNGIVIDMFVDAESVRYVSIGMIREAVNEFVESINDYLDRVRIYDEEGECKNFHESDDLVITGDAIRRKTFKKE